jgi:hypothetical protein
MMESAGGMGRGLQSVGAVVAGMMAVVVLSIVTDTGLGEVGVLPEPGKPMVDEELYVLPTIYRSLYTVIGAYVTAWLAPSAPLRHALAFGGLILALNVIGGVVEHGFGPTWYPVMLTLLSLPCAWLGGALRTRWA